MENRLISTVLDTDSYKFSHWVQYPKGTTAMYSYLESRGGEFPKTLFFGLQYYLKQYLTNPITAEEVEEAAEFAKLHGTPFNYEGWMHIVNEHGGKLPVRIKAVREGSLVPTSNILMSVESLDPKVFWVVSWLETMLVRLWYPITVATNSHYIKLLIKQFMEDTSDGGLEGLDFKLHDFGSRGVSSQESAMIGGAAHLVNFKGSDTIAGVYAANKFYDSEMSAFSIPASEHSTMTMWGRENEVEAYRNMLKQYEGQPIFACVSDSYDIYNAVEHLWGGELKEEVQRFGGTVVVRPDSGHPATVVLKTLELLDKRFGSEVNSKGYKVINNNVRVIQGDGIEYRSIAEILKYVTAAGFSAENVNFGMGGALLQKMDRDTCKFAFKCSAAEVDGEWIDVYKDPVDSFKTSKKGKMRLVKDGPTYYTVREEEAPAGDELVTVYESGEILETCTLEEVRSRADSEM